MRIYLLAVFLLLSLSAAPQSPRGILETDRVATPILIVEPKFPYQVSHEKFPIEIKITGIITEKGQMTSSSFSYPDGKEKFVDVISDVLPSWRFMPALNPAACSTTDSKMTMSVWFDMPSGKPSISVSIPKEARSVAASSTEAYERTSTWVPRRWKKAPQISFPRDASRHGVEGAAAVLMKVNWAGDIVDTMLWYYTPHEAFGEAVLEGIQDASFEPGPDDKVKSKMSCIIVPVGFCFVDSSASYPNSLCRRGYRSQVDSAKPTGTNLPR